MRSHTNRLYPRAALGVTRLEVRETPSTTSTLGSHESTRYAGTPDDLRATSGIAAVPTAGASAGTHATTTSLAAASATVPHGKPVNLTVTVRSAAGTPSGTVTFRDGAREFGRVGLSDGKAAFSTSGLAVGPHRITATYNGSPSHGGSTGAPATVTVSASATPPGNPPATRSTATTLTAAAATVALNKPVNLTARVRPISGNGTVTGTVTFNDGDRALGTATLRDGAATFSTPGLTRGSHRLTAVYAGTSSFNGSASSSVAVAVGTDTPPASSAAATTTWLAASTSSLTAGHRVTLTATVRPTSGTATPGGTVTFRDGTTVIGTATLFAGRAVLPTAALSAGMHSFTAVYGGASAFRTSASSWARVSVSSSTSRTSTATSLSASATTAPVGSPITFTATVRRSSGTAVPTGTVTFRNGSVIVGTVSVTPGGTAAVTLRTLKAGSHLITATYIGDSRYAGSASTPQPVTVTAAPAAVGTATAITAVIPPSASSSASGPVTIKAKVAPLSASSITPTGRVTFRKNTVVLGSTTLDRYGMATLVLPSRALAAGQNYVTAFYEGDNRYAPDGGSDFIVLRN